jgi:hypothetical protein
MKKPVRRLLFILLSLAVLIALFYAEENWRGKRAWENCKSELMAKGEVLDWSAYIPPPVPREQNFFKAPKMAEWFVGRGETDLSKRMVNPQSGWFAASDQITNQIQARDYLAWSDQFVPDFKLISKALELPYARIDADYTPPSEMPVPNFITFRSVAQTLAQRAHCYLLLNQPERALSELTLMRGTCRVLEDPPTGKTITLVAAMINVAIIGLYTEIVTEGLESHSWQAPQLRVLQQQIAEINVLPFVVQSFRVERAGCCQTLETLLRRNSTWQMIKHGTIPFAPRGWFYQNLLWIAKLDQVPIQVIDCTNQLIRVTELNDASRTQSELAHPGPYTFLAAMAVPDFSKAWQTTAHNQTMVNETQTACALERYHLVHGQYPKTLDALVPQFIEKLPHDIIGGQPLHYHRMADGKFLLYSVGWNETDDGGQVAPMKAGRPDMKIGDWVWEN